MKRFYRLSRSFFKYNVFRLKSYTRFKGASFLFIGYYLFLLKCKLVVQSMLSSFLKEKVYMNFCSMVAPISHSTLVARYIVVKLSKHYNIFETVFPVIKVLKRRSAIFGYKISCSGRFKRKLRATYFWRHGGKMSYSSF